MRKFSLTIARIIVLLLSYNLSYAMTIGEALYPTNGDIRVPAPKTAMRLDSFLAANSESEQQLLNAVHELSRRIVTSSMLSDFSLSRESKTRFIFNRFEKAHSIASQNGYSQELHEQINLRYLEVLDLFAGRADLRMPRGSTLLGIPK